MAAGVWGVARVSLLLSLSLTAHILVVVDAAGVSAAAAINAMRSRASAIIEMAPAEDENEARNCNLPEFAEYCLGRCRVLDSWANMGLGMEYGPSLDLVEEYGHMQLWKMCPLTFLSMAMEIARRQLLVFPSPLRGQGRLVMLEVEELVSRLFQVFDLNLTKYFHPRITSAAPFYRLQRLVDTARQRGAAGAGDVSAGAATATAATATPTASGDRDDADGLAAVRAAVGVGGGVPSFWVGPTLGNADGSDVFGMSNDCSLRSVALGLAGAIDDQQLVSLAVLDPRAEVDEWAAGAPLRVNRRFNDAQKCMERLAQRGPLVRQVIEEGSPLFAVLDRLDCRTPVIVSRELPLGDAPGLASWQVTPFSMHVLPMRDFESNFMRSYARFHCDDSYKAALLRRHEQAVASGRLFRVAEIGAYLGGCTFWALVHLRNTRAVAVEQFGPAVEAMRRTAFANRLPSPDVFDVLGTCVSDSSAQLRPVFNSYGDVRQPGMAPEGGRSGPEYGWPETTTAAAEEAMKCTRLDEVLLGPRLPEGERWDLVRIHTSGHELSVLRSGLETLRSRRVRTIAAMLPGKNCGEACLAVARLLLDFGARLRYRGSEVRQPLDLEDLYVDSVQLLYAHFPPPRRARAGRNHSWR
eukprot:TRINITY_DN28631_c0_g2_i1.p1 TRINITY_DN28631_c0_g2~~TRINITY_DN28631_c0_g2_i1.p1  ORF type:complete len:637 (-),score=134.42 TRINITY_DN28631_c0_g2_i1:89-1999(-)